MQRGKLLQVLLLIILGLLGVFLLYNLSSSLSIMPDEAKAALKAGQYDAVVDVRTPAEWTLGHYPLAIHIPVADLDNELPKRIPNKSSKILFYCNTSTRARVAAEKAEKLGYKNIRYLIGTHVNILS